MHVSVIANIEDNTCPVEWTKYYLLVVNLRNLSDKE